MLRVWVNGIEVPRAEVEPLEFARAIDCEDCCERVRVRGGASIRSERWLAMVVPLLDMLRGTLL